MATRKIAYLSPLYFSDGSYLGGGERYPLNLARGVVFASKGTCEVELISFGTSPRSMPIEPGVSLRVISPARTPHNPLDVVSWDLPKALADTDLVHIHQAFTRCGEMGMLVAKMLRKPVCVTDHGGVTSSLGAELGHLELADHVIAQSDFATTFLGRCGTPVSVIKGGVDATLFAPPVTSPTRESVLYVGRILPHKGIDNLIQAMPTNVPLTVCGRAYHADYLRLLKQRARGKRVTFMTSADDADLRRLYGNALVNVLPSVYTDVYGNVYRAPELMGLTLLEAMACGAPVICSRVGGMPEFVAHGQSGFVYDTIDQLRQTILQLAQNRALADQMGRSARRLVETHYDIKIVGKRILAIYDDLIHPGSRREVAA